MLTSAYWKQTKTRWRTFVFVFLTPFLGRLCSQFRQHSGNNPSPLRLPPSIAAPFRRPIIHPLWTFEKEKSACNIGCVSVQRGPDSWAASSGSTSIIRTGLRRASRKRKGEGSWDRAFYLLWADSYRPCPSRPSLYVVHAWAAENWAFPGTDCTSAVALPPEPKGLARPTTQQSVVDGADLLESHKRAQ